MSVRPIWADESSCLTTKPALQLALLSDSSSTTDTDALARYTTRAAIHELAVARECETHTNDSTRHKSCERRYHLVCVSAQHKTFLLCCCLLSPVCVCADLGVRAVMRGGYGCKAHAKDTTRPLVIDTTHTHTHTPPLLPLSLRVVSCRTSVVRVSCHVA